ncbi:MAG: PadR family transcriptional regulator [Bryobacteraceae bacterium]|nr:PadR family transcriptional regulator [Bryobacteraceae bacterium]
MPKRFCEKHGESQPCTCAMGNLYRFVEPVILLLLKKKGRSYGYDLAAELAEHAMTDADIERAALYRTLRQLEEYGNVVSEWEGDVGGRARRVYRLTPAGETHLQEWVTVLEQVSRSMARFVRNGKRAISAAPKKASVDSTIRAQKRVKAR